MALAHSQRATKPSFLVTLGGVLAAALLLIALSSPAQAQMLYNTGATNVGGFDQNYQYGGTTATAGDHSGASWTNAVIGVSGPFPIPSNWFDNNASSSWLRPGTQLSDATAPSNNGAVQSIFVFKTEFFFDASLYSLSASSFTLNAASDNALGVYLNNSAVELFGSGIVHTSFPGFNASDVVTQSNGLMAGMNTLYFYVTNVAGSADSNPSGLRVEVEANLVQNFTPVPEPSTYGLMGAGMLGLTVWLRRRFRGSRSVVAA